MATGHRPSHEERALRRQVDKFFLRVPYPDPDWKQPSAKTVRFYKSYDSVDDNTELARPYKEITYLPDWSPKRPVYQIPVENGGDQIDSRNGTILYRAPRPPPGPVVDLWQPTFGEDKPRAWTDLRTSEKLRFILWDVAGRTILLLLFLFLITLALEALGLAMVLMLGGVADTFLHNQGVVQNPLGALMGGLLVGALAQDTVWPVRYITSYSNLVVFPPHEGTFLLMGLHIGSTVTGMFTSIVFLTNQHKTRRAMGGVFMHYAYCTASVLVLLPFEAAVGMLYYLAWGIVDAVPPENRSGGVFFLRCVTTTILEAIVQVEFVPSSRITDLSVSWRHAKVVCYSDTDPPERGPCSYLMRPLVDDMSDVVIGFILFGSAIITILLCFPLFYKLLQSMVSGRVAAKLQKYLTDEGSYFGDAIVFVTSTILAIFIQNMSIFTCLLMVLMGLGVFGRRRLFSALAGCSFGYSLGLLSIALSLQQPSGAEFGIICVFLNFLGFVFWFPIPYMRRCIKYVANYMGKNTAQYRWIILPLAVLIYCIIPLIFIGFALGGVIPFSVICSIIFVFLLILLIVNVMQRTKSKLLPDRLKDWDELPPWVHSLKPYDEKMCHTKLRMKRKRYKRRKPKGDPARFMENRRVYLYDWDAPSASSTYRSTDTLR